MEIIILSQKIVTNHKTVIFGGFKTMAVQRKYQKFCLDDRVCMREQL